MREWNLTVLDVKLHNGRGKLKSGQSLAKIFYGQRRIRKFQIGHFRLKHLAGVWRKFSQVHPSLTK